MTQNDIKSKIKDLENQLASSYKKSARVNLEAIIYGVIYIAKYFGHQDVVDWAKSELGGYIPNTEVPSYRIINYSLKIRSRLGKSNESINNLGLYLPINEIIEKSKKSRSKFAITKGSETDIIYFNKYGLKKVIEGVKARIREYLSLIHKEIDTKRDELHTNKCNKIEEIIDNTALSSYLNSNNERKTFSNNLKSLYDFELMSNHKYCMIAMGSLLEFLLKKYCEKKKISPEPFNKRSGKNFANYLESAIKNNLFQEKMRWQLVQTHLRDFRNYVHIDKEIKSTEIDKKWYETMVPCFEALFNQFKNYKI